MFSSETKQEPLNNDAISPEQFSTEKKMTPLVEVDDQDSLPTPEEKLMGICWIVDSDRDMSGPTVCEVKRNPDKPDQLISVAFENSSCCKPCCTRQPGCPHPARCFDSNQHRFRDKEQFCQAVIMSKPLPQRSEL